jgi:hypothetical protein
MSYFPISYLDILHEDRSEVDYLYDLLVIRLLMIHVCHSKAFYLNSKKNNNTKVSKFPYDMKLSLVALIFNLFYFILEFLTFYSFHFIIFLAIILLENNVRLISVDLTDQDLITDNAIKNLTQITSLVLDSNSKVKNSFILIIASYNQVFQKLKIFPCFST